jgi:hypothetical protein
MISEQLPEAADTGETGVLGVMHLKRLWSRTMRTRAGEFDAASDLADWNATDTVIRGLGLGLHETLAFLYGSGPPFDAFERWILEKNGGAIAPERIERINAALTGTLDPNESRGVAEPVFDERDLAFWEENGYVALHEAVSIENCRAAEDAIWEFLQMNRDDPATWYGCTQGHSIWVPLLHHPAIEANRRAPRIARAFEQLWKRSDLWMTVDQSGFNPPERSDWPFPGPHLHFDVSLELPIPLGMQGLLYLTDTSVEQGAFRCVPGFHRNVGGWLNSLPSDADPRLQDLEALGAVPIAGRAGDLIIWHQALPHGSSPNRSTRPRIVQYLSMRPADAEHRDRWR